MKKNYIKPISKVESLHGENLLQFISVSVNGSYSGGGGGSSTIPDGQ